ncbi:4'-phosphopantetheinyl transferase entD [Pseudomonas sp. OF001]|uniref:4'-phosphopantetheinyl transferase family protein n=1 Tax=Pseudomonas sp. OF001 TaxID=2772300 RepID=UPI0019185775|nr:4'-phosphopantetheinyl transferase superfamily protein [Pseudomonas sp. OF001]CAD5376923.1 4'-phosphopantetheinyl transferase entD [Pseudomonas sp. OF001]
MPAPLPLPACCSAPVTDWVLPQALPGLHLHSCRFDPAQLAADDFARCALAAPAGIASAARKRQSEFLAGRLCAASALQALCGQSSYPARGADNAPCWPAGVTGSITHSHGWAAALVGAQDAWRGLGLDAERLLGSDRAERLAGEILTADELAHFRRLPEAERGLHLTLCFSLKESLFKALYPLVGRRFWFHAAALVEQAGDGRVRLQLREDLDGEWRQGRCLDGQFAVREERLLSLVAVAAD